MESEIPEYRVYGDNILECERALSFLVEAVASPTGTVSWVPGPPYAPQYELREGSQVAFRAQLFPGYGRWKYDVQDHLRRMGAPLREAADAVVLRLHYDKGQAIGVPILAFEFCGALPAGNNAWQRCGRALSFAEAGVPYLYFAEIGGVELDGLRNVIAARLPNPLVPFSYLTLGQASRSIVAPVFTLSPSSSEEVARPFLDCLGGGEARDLVRSVMTGTESPASALRVLYAKAASTVRILADARRREDTLRGEEWDTLARLKTGAEKAAWLLERGMTWVKKISIKGRTRSLLPLISEAIRAGAVAVGSRDMPICVIGPRGRLRFAEAVAHLYSDRINREFLEWLGGQDQPLVIVWVAGFKPRGDDSRPDRGLVPLARMLFGPVGLQYLTVIFGPAREEVWRLFESDMNELARTNGLWEAIIGLSDAILVDSSTAGELRNVGVLIERSQSVKRAGPSALALDPSESAVFGEHDVDTVLHMVFTNAIKAGVFEGLCNPPGGDWSGISFLSQANSEIVRWTSLPRVSGAESKRPDHFVVFYGPPTVLLTVESKDTASTVEAQIGPRLAKYIRDLFAVAPNIVRTIGSNWRLYSGPAVTPVPEILTGAAFRYSSAEEMRAVLRHAAVDVVLATEFFPGEERVLLHVVTASSAKWLGSKIRELCERFSGRIEVQIH